jgi:hypothetical protein
MQRRFLPACNGDYTPVGKFVVKDGHLTTVDLQRLVEKHNRATRRLLKRK